MPTNEKKTHIIHRVTRPLKGQAAPEPVSQPSIRRVPSQPVENRPKSAPDAGADQTLSARDEIELIKSENLTGRQLRIARRVAQKHGLQVTSDLDAVRVLRKNGIDPFQSSNNMLKMAAENTPATTPSNLPAAIRRTEISNATTKPLDNHEREVEVRKIQLDLVKRRRKRIAATVTKLICFVLLPAILAGYYFYRVATPMYASYTEFLIQKADNPSMGGAGLGGLLNSSLLATAQDSVAVQGYLSSRDAMSRLDRDLGFKQAFQGDKIDPLQRLDADVTNESTYDEYKKRVRIGFDPTEGIIKMEVVTPDPELSYKFSMGLIGYAEQQVDQLTHRLRKDQMKGATDGYKTAEIKFAEAQDRVVMLQEKLGVLSPESEIAAQMSLIQLLETELQQKRLELIELMDNLRPNKTKLSVLKSSIKSREGMIVKLRSELTQGSDVVSSLAKVTADLRSAQAQLLLRQELLSASLLQFETSRVEANRQTRYLSMAVSPVIPDEASYPKAFENTLLATLVFAALYLMVSLTASILREQLTS